MKHLLFVGQNETLEIVYWSECILTLMYIDVQIYLKVNKGWSDKYSKDFCE